jgi:DNA primase
MDNSRFIEDLKHRIDLLEIVKRYTSIKKAGRNYVAKSPFRNERTPSFSISPEKQMWYDFGSSEGGDVISLVEKTENMSFLEAVEFLAEFASLDLPENFGENMGPSRELKQDIFDLHKKATEFFAQEMQKSEIAQKYCKNRGITIKIIKNWNLGFGGLDMDGLGKYLLKSGFSEAQIAESGVGFLRSFGDKKIQDRFWGRLIIPLCEPRNSEIIGFSGREILDREKSAKYLNSPENPVYHKSSTLFGFDRAKEAIRELDNVILVEGNFDVIFAQEAGFKNTVATCGTSLTDEHLRMLKRITKNFYIAFDNDLAGKKATLRSVEMCLKLELNPFIVELPKVKDFGEFLEDSKNIPKLKEILKTTINAMDYLFDRFLKKYVNGSLEGDKKFLDAFFYFLKLIKRPIEVDDFIKKIAEKLARPKNIIEAEFQKYLVENQRFNKEKFVPETVIRFSREETFLGFLLINWHFFAETIKNQKDKIIPLFLDPKIKQLLLKKIAEIDYSKAEEQEVLAWEMYCENLYEDNNKEFLKNEFMVFIDLLKKEKTKQERLQAAADFRNRIK